MKRLTTLCLGGCLLLAAVAGRGGEGPANAQKPPANAAKALPGDTAEKDLSEDDSLFATGGSIETDPEIETLLQRAAELAADRSFQDAAIIYQHVLDNSGDLLVLATSRPAAGSPAKTPERIYRPLQEHIERLLTAPDRRELLSAYRLSADPEVQAVLEAEDRRFSETALRQAVRRFFASSFGDDAAYRLGCLLLDRHEFTAARRLFAKVLSEHPDPSVPRRDLLIRLALSSARAGDARSAEEALAKLRAEPSVPPELLSKLRAEIAAGGSLTAPETMAWHMDLGTPARDGRMKPIPEEFTQKSRLWTEAWQQQADSRAPSPAKSAGYPGVPQNRAQIVARWKATGWFPAGDLLLDAGRVYVKSNGFRDPASQEKSGGRGLLCVDAVTGKLLWFAKEDWSDVGAGTQIDQTLFMMRAAGRGLPNSPATSDEVDFFNNHLGRSLTLCDGVVYHLEGPVQGGGQNVMMRVFINNQHLLGRHGHALVATDAVTGKVRWRAVGVAPRAPVRPDQAGVFGAASASPDDRWFLAPPVKAGQSLLVPVVRNGAVSVQALATQDGRVLWEQPLFGESGPTLRYAPVALAVEGSEAYVAAGAGLVFALDATDGRILWAARYCRDRAGTAGTTRAAAFGIYGALPAAEGWTRDVLIPRGGVLLVMPSDAKKIFYFDRRTGELRGALDQGEAKYVLGVLGERLFVAGSDQVACYSAHEPRRIWTAGSQQGVAGLTGRGALSDQAIYLPLANEVLVLNPNNGKPSGRITVHTSQQEPIGNLLSDGTRLVASGMDRTYALVEGAAHLAKLEELIQQGDVGSMVSRAALRKRLGAADEALADLRLAYQTTRSDSEKESIRAELLEGLFSAARRQPDKAAACLDEAAELAKLPQQRARLDLARARRLIDLGQAREALPALMALAVDPDGTLLPLDGEAAQVRTLSSQLAAVELQKLLSRDDAGLRGALATHARAELAKIEARAAEQNKPSGAYVAALLAGMRAFEGTEAAVEAAQKAAAHFEQQGVPELAECVLRQLQRSPHRPTAAAGTAALAELYQRIGWKDEAADAWRRLAQEADSVAVLGRNGQTAKQLAGRQLAGLPAATGNEPEAGRRMPDPPWKQLWHTGQALEIGLGQPADAASRFLQRHMLLAATQRQQATLVELATGQQRWALPLPQGAASFAHMRYGIAGLQGWQPQGGSLARDGHVALLWSPNEMLAVGLIEGKRLWEAQGSKKPDKNAANPQVAAAVLGSRYYPYGVMARPFDLNDGLIAEVVWETTGNVFQVRALDLASGKVLWEREFDIESVRGVIAHERYVLVALQDSGDLFVCDRGTGARVGRLKIPVPAAGNPQTWVLPTEQGVIHVGPQGIVMRRLPDGQTMWTLPFSFTGVSRIERPNPDLLCVAGYEAAGKMRAMVIDTRSGAAIAEFSSPLAGRGFSIAVTPDGRQVRFILHDGLGRFQAGIVDLASGKITSTLQCGRVQQPLIARDLAAAGDIVPVAVQQPPVRQGNAYRYTNLYGVWFLRKSDGKVLKGLKLPSDRPDGQFEHLQQLRLQGEVLLVFCVNGVYAFAHDPAGPAPQFEAVEPSSAFPTLPAGVAGQPAAVGRGKVVGAKRVAGGKIVVEAEPAPEVQEKQQP